MCVRPESAGEPAKEGRAALPGRLEACKRWLIDRLTPFPARVKDIRVDAGREGYDVKLLYRAYEAIGGEEYLLEGRKWWKLPVST